MRNLASEQIPNDGGYHLYQLIDATNRRLKNIGAHGKRATIKVVPKPNKPISIQFSLKGKQVQRGLNLQLNKTNLLKAEEICMLVSSQLVANTFTEDWLNSLLGKHKNTLSKTALTCKSMLEIYKKHYLQQRKKNKAPDGTWYNNYRHIEKVLNSYPNISIRVSSSNLV